MNMMTNVAVERVCVSGAGVSYLVVLEDLDQLLARLQQRHLRARMLLVLELHRRPRRVQLLQYLLHAHLLHRLVHDVAHLVLEVVQVQRQQVGERRRLVHREAHLGGSTAVNCCAPVWRPSLCHTAAYSIISIVHTKISLETKAQQSHAGNIRQ